MLFGGQDTALLGNWIVGLNEFGDHPSKHLAGDYRTESEPDDFDLVKRSRTNRTLGISHKRGFSRRGVPFIVSKASLRFTLGFIES